MADRRLVTCQIRQRARSSRRLLMQTEISVCTLIGVVAEGMALLLERTVNEAGRGAVAGGGLLLEKGCCWRRVVAGGGLLLEEGRSC